MDNKQIEEIYQEILTAEREFFGKAALNVEKYVAKHLYNAGYRKERRGEWIDLYKGKYENKLYACSVCRKGAFLRVEANELNTPRTVQALTPYCPHCGSKMKGVE